MAIQIDKSQIAGTTAEELVSSVVNQLKRYGLMAVSDEDENEIKKTLEYCKPVGGHLYSSIAQRFIYGEFEFTIREHYYDAGSDDYVYSVSVWQF